MLTAPVREEWKDVGWMNTTLLGPFGCSCAAGKLEEV